MDTASSTSNVPPAPSATGGDSSLYPIAILIDELKHDDAAVRLNSMKRIQEIGRALGTERTRQELIPFLHDSLDDEDEVLLVMAEELGSFVELCGGPSMAYPILVPLESLATVDEVTVRDKASASIRQVVSQMSPEDILSYYIPLIKRLASRDWYTSRMSVCSLLEAAYGAVDEEVQSELRVLFGNLCRDVTPMVRRSAAKAMANIIPLISSQFVLSEIMPLFLLLAEDDQDSVRLQTVDNAVAMAKHLSEGVLTNQILPVITQVIEDRSWRVRWSGANAFPSLCEAVGEKLTNTILCEKFGALLQDPEAEVRTAAAFKVAEVTRQNMKSEAIVDRLIPAMQPLATDQSDHVRAAFASVIMGVAPVIGSEQTVQYLLPLFLQLLRDANSEVRLNIISNLGEGNKVIGIKLLSQSLLPAIMELAEDRQWRVRLAIIEYIPLIAGQLGIDFFNEKLSGLCMKWLGDNVFSIREAATLNLRKLTEQFGREWAKQTILPKIFNMHTNSNYLYRMTSLNAVKVLSDALSIDMTVEMMLPLVIQLAQDPVPNIRFNVAKTIEQLLPKLKDPEVQSDSQSSETCSKIVQDQILPCLTTLVNDSDSDVQYFASRALKACG